MATAIMGLALAGAADLSRAQPAAAESGLVKRAVELRETPSDSARSLGTLAAQTAVTRTGRQGGWVQVRTAQGATGWLALYDVVGAAVGGGSSAPSGNALTGGLRGLTSLMGGSQSTTTASSLSGIRGLTEEDIAKADPNPAALDQAESMRVDANTARQFAAAAQLASRKVEPLPAPSGTTSSSSAFREAP